MRSHSLFPDTAFPGFLLLLVALLFTLFVWLDQQPAHTQPAPPASLVQLTDQQLDEQSSDPAGFVALNGAVYFGLNRSPRGLWRTDGTAAGTTRIADVPLSPSFLHRVGNSLYFQGHESLSLWISDGTAAGTRLLRDDIETNIQRYVQRDGITYFAASDGVHGIELWQSDGSPTGTTMIVDSAPDWRGNDITELVATTERVYYIGNEWDADGTYVRSGRLWGSDGTAAGTALVTGVTDHVTALTVFQNDLYFTALDDTNQLALWRYGDAATPPTLVQALFPGSTEASLLEFVPVGEQFFFTADDNTTGTQLWRSDGTSGGTQLLKQGEPDYFSGSLQDLTAVGNQLYFTVYSPTEPRSLWKSDGSVTGTLRIKAITGPESGVPSYAPSHFAVVDETLYFLEHPDGGDFLWRSDGTADGTVPVVQAGIMNMQAAGDALYMSLLDTGDDYELGRSDGTAQGTQIIADLNPTRNGPLISQTRFVHGRLYIVGSFADGQEQELWVSENGTQPATLLDTAFARYDLYTVGERLFVATDGSDLWLLDPETDQLILLGTYANLQLYDAEVVNGQLFFFTQSPPFGDYSLMRSDGTPEGTVRLLTNIPRTMYVTAEQVIVASGSQLFITDGTVGAVRIMAPADANGPIQTVIPGETRFYFSAAAGPTGGAEQGIWRSDGTTEGTARLSTPEPLTEVRYGYAVGDALYVLAASAAHDSELWHAAPTATSLVRLTDVPNDRIGFGPGEFSAVGNDVYFVIDDGIHGLELWTSDGTPGGTHLVKDILTEEDYPAPYFAYPTPLRGAASFLYFFAYDRPTGRELWRSDGTEEGTTVIRDIAPGQADSSPQEILIRGDTAYFTARTDGDGRELWRSDGTAAGTQRVADLFGGTAESSPNLFSWVNELLFFTANNGRDGRQLFRLDTGAPLALPPAPEPTPYAQPHQIYLPQVSR